MATSMPFAKIPHFLTRDTGLSDGAYRTYGLLLAYARQNDSTWVSQGTLAAALCVSLDTIQRRMKELEAADLVTVHHRGARRTNLIRIATERQLEEIYGPRRLAGSDVR